MQTFVHLLSPKANKELSLKEDLEPFIDEVHKKQTLGKENQISGSVNFLENLQNRAYNKAVSRARSQISLFEVAEKVKSTPKSSLPKVKVSKKLTKPIEPLSSGVEATRSQRYLFSPVGDKKIKDIYSRRASRNAIRKHKMLSNTFHFKLSKSPDERQAEIQSPSKIVDTIFDDMINQRKKVDQVVIGNELQTFQTSPRMEIE